MNPNGGHDDPDYNPADDPDFDPEDDDFTVVPVIPANEVEEDEQVDAYGNDNEDDEEDEDDEEEEEEPEENPDDNFWVAHPAKVEEDHDENDNDDGVVPAMQNEDDTLPEMDCQEVFNPNPDYIPIAMFEMPSDWNEGAVPLEEDYPVVFHDLFDPKPLSPLIKMERKLASMIEERDNLIRERDRLLTQRDKDGDEIAGSWVKIAQLQAKVQRVKANLKQTRSMLKIGKLKTGEVEEQAAQLEAVINGLCIKLGEEMCFANKENDLMDQEFQAYVHHLVERRQARRFNGPQLKARDMVAGEGASHTVED